MKTSIKKLLFVGLSVFTILAHAENQLTEEQILEDETQLLVQTCKDSLFSLYKESIEYPEEFRFDKIKAYVNEKEQLSVISMKYKARRGTEIFTQNFECSYAGGSSSNFFKDKQNNWELVRQTTSY